MSPTVFCTSLCYPDGSKRTRPASNTARTAAPTVSAPRGAPRRAPGARPRSPWSSRRGCRGWLLQKPPPSMLNGNRPCGGAQGAVGDERAARALGAEAEVLLRLEDGDRERVVDGRVVDVCRLHPGLFEGAQARPARRCVGEVDAAFVGVLDRLALPEDLHAPSRQVARHLGARHDAAAWRPVAPSDRRASGDRRRGRTARGSPGRTARTPALPQRDGDAARHGRERSARPRRWRHRVAALAGRVAMITGGGRGIGAATARRLLADGASA